jgi:acyl-[acyl-carrier-protein]-phospholipid O-acyltransferase/long-chain-fatty-acid--[acyl-carrier-protein] ligase
MTRRFAPLFWCQFFSAFSDNFLKNALVFLILFHPDIGGSHAGALVTLAAAVFIAPYFFLSALGGELADRFDKAKVAQRIKLAEIGVALIAVLGFSLHSIPVLFFALFMFGVIASLFGPIKYGILPDHLQRSELPAGNALVEGATFIAILLGTIVGGIAAKNGGDPARFALLMIVFSLMCWGASLFIPPTGQAAPHIRIQANVLKSTGGLLRFLREDPRLWWGAIVTSWFWLVGAVALSLMPTLVKEVLGGNEQVVTTCLAVFSISIAVGSGLAAWLAAGRIILLPTLLGAVLLGIFAIDLGWSTNAATKIAGLDSYLAIFQSFRGMRFAVDLSGLAIAGGLFIVPVFAAVQAWAGADRKIIAVFPEGTRGESDHLGEFKKGGFLIAKKAAVPIVPVGILGSRKLLSRRELFPRGGQVTVNVGPVIGPEQIKELTVEGLSERVRSAMNALLGWSD